jgi:AraC family transcriptional regulator
MSAFHFARLFKLSTGRSPHRFVVARRIDHAKRLVAAEGVSIAAVSRAFGFRTPSHFTTVFRRVTGLAPSAYRSVARASVWQTTSSPGSGPALGLGPGADSDRSGTSA